MRIKKALIIACLFFIQKYGFGATALQQCYLLNANYEIVDSINNFEINVELQNKKRPNPLLQVFRAKQKKNKRITAAVLAFPFPFGIVGLHRIYLGTAPYVPVVYIGSFGGIFGILPFIDFCFLVFHKDEKKFIENKKVFMWID